ncbi:MAG: AAA family ATPase [Terricaulis silvestris]
MDSYRARRAEARRDRARPRCDKHFAFASASAAFAVRQRAEAARPGPPRKLILPEVDPVNTACLADIDSEAAWPFGQVDDGFAPAPAFMPEAATPAPANDSVAAPPEADEEPPFDPPDEDDDIFRGAPRSEEEAAELAAGPQPEARPTFVTEPAAESEPAAIVVEEPPAASFSELPLPPLAIHASWDRPEIANMLAAFAAHPQISRADVTIKRGGVDGAAVHLSTHPSPDLLIIDSTLGAKEMLRGLDRVRKVMAPTTKLVVLGAVNDIGLLRELSARGASHYIVSPFRQEDLIRAVCGLYEESDKSRVIAVIGARGGVGASTFANNLAWSIAEHQGVGAALVDLDLPFGTAAFQVNAQGKHSVADALAKADELDNAALDRLAIRHTERLKILNAPASLDRALELDGEKVDLLIRRVRRSSAFVVLDLPHCWTSWIKTTLVNADEVIIVASPDLTSLRNAKNILDWLTGQRPKSNPATVALSMVGVPKRPEIAPKDFADAIGAEPIAAFAFDPDLFGLAMVKSAMLGQVAPESKAALAFDALAAGFAGDHAAERGEIIVQRAAPTPASVDMSETLVLTQQAIEPLPPEPARDVHELREERRRPRRGALFATAAVGMAATVALAGTWVLQNRTHLLHMGADAQAAPAPAAPPQSAAQPAAPAAAALDPASAYQAAVQMMRNGNTDDGVALLTRAANGGNALAQYRLAKLYEFGDGVAIDATQAREWTARAATAGNRHAMQDLGVFLAHGEGGPIDESGAMRWFTQAAELGLTDSQISLAQLYEQGHGVAANASEAMYWYLVAAREGVATAADHAVSLEAQLTSDEVEQAHARADAFQPKPVDPTAN